MLDVLLGLEHRQEPDLDLRQVAPLFTTSTYAGEWREWARHQGEALLSIATCWQAVQLISGDLAKLPILKMVRDEDGDGNVRERQQPSHPTWRIVHDRPTRNMGAFKFWRRFWVSCLIWSNGYIRINRDQFGRPESFTLLESMMVSHSVGPFEDEGYFYITQNAEWVFIPADDMIHVEDLAVHRQSTVGGQVRNRPMWLIEQSHRQIGIDLAIDNYGEAFFQRGGRAGGWLELPAAMRKKSRDTVEKGFKDVYENLDAAFSTIIARGGVKFHPSSINPNDTQMNESRQENVKNWARRFNLPPHKLGDDSRTSYNSLEQENKAYYDSSLAPRARSLTDELKAKLLMPFERASGRHFYRHDISQMTEADLETRTETATKLYTGRVAMLNEARELVGLNPIDDGDTFADPPNMSLTQEPEAQDEPPPDDETEDERSIRIDLTREPLLNRLANALQSMNGYAERKSRQMTATAFANWLDTLENHGREVWDKMIDSTARAYAKASGQAVDQLKDKLFAATCAELRAKIREDGPLIPDNRALCLLERVEDAGIRE